MPVTTTLDAILPPVTAVQMSGNKLQGLATGVANTDAATTQ